MRQSKRRTLLVAIDAACWEYLDPLLAEGDLPTIQRLVEQGVHGVLESPLPPLTPVAWSSIVTGKAPSKHGVYEWVRRQRDSYNFVPFMASSRRGTPFWERLAAAGIKTGLVNVPLTYPPPAVDGFAICGFGTPDSAKEFAYPAEVQSQVESWCGPYSPAGPEASVNHGELGALLEAEHRQQEQQVELSIRASESYDVDLLVINLMLVDHANHYASSMRRIREAAIQTDAHLGQLLKGFGPDTVLLFSDHGSRRIHGRFLLGAWLNDHGYCAWSDRRQIERDYVNWLFPQVLGQQQDHLKLGGKVVCRLAVEAWMHMPSQLAELGWKVVGRRLPLDSTDYWAVPRLDTQATKVYVGAVAGCLYLNVEGREPHGMLTPEQKEQVLPQLMSELSCVADPDTGKPLFSRIYGGEELYSDRATGQAPDLVVDHNASQWALSLQLPPPSIPREGYFVRDTDGWYGEHGRQGVFIFSGKDIAVESSRKVASLVDVPATLLHLYNVPIPDDYDGRVLSEVLEPGFCSDQPVRLQSGDANEIPDERADGLASESDAMLSRLRALGYVE